MSYRKVFSVVTEHTASTVAARYAISVAASCHSDLVLYSAVEEGGSESTLLRTDRHMDHLFNVAFELDIQVTRITEAGKLSELLPARVRAEKADLVFYPLAPHEEYGSNLQRHTVHHLLRTIRCDLAIMRVVNMAKPHPGHILMPLAKMVRDGEHRLIFIAELAKSFHSRVTLFHLSPEGGSKEMPEDIVRFRRGLQQQLVTVLERNGSGVIGKSITVEAITRHNDLIVLGSSERGVLQRVLFGNPAGDVMHHPPCNTILFRAAR